MNNKIILNLGIILAVVLASCSLKTTKQKEVVKNLSPLLDTLDSRLQAAAATKILPGFGVAVFTKDSIIYSKGFGYANIEQ